MDKYGNILITGGCGFIGSNFINFIFNKCDANIINVDKMTYVSKEDNIKENIRHSKRYKLYKINISENEKILSILTDNNVDIVINFAAQSHVTTSFNNSKQFMKDNIMATHSLLEMIRIYNKIKLMIHISTDEVYGESNLSNQCIPKTEDCKLEPTNPYSASKAAAEMIVKSYIYSFNLPIIITRGNNVYGPNQYPEKVVPKFINQLKNNKKITIEGTGNNKRTFIHTEDVSEALYTIITKGTICETYNIGNNDDEFTIIEIASILIKEIKKTNNIKSYITYIKDRIYNDKRYFIDYSKLLNLGWKPKKNLHEEILKLI